MSCESGPVVEESAGHPGLKLRQIIMIKCHIMNVLTCFELTGRGGDTSDWTTRTGILSGILSLPRSQFGVLSILCSEITSQCVTQTGSFFDQNSDEPAYDV